jgi:hypothetical protein
MKKETTTKHKELKTTTSGEKRGDPKTKGAQKQRIDSSTKLAPLN